MTHLHVHTNVDSILSVDELIAQVIEHNHSACAITDHGNILNVEEFKQKAIKNGIKPIFGMEGYMSKSHKARKDHIILLANNDNGFNNIKRLNDIILKHGRFTLKDLLNNKEDITIGTACLASPFAREKDSDLLEELCSNFNVLAEIQLNESIEQKQYNDWIIYNANKLGIPIVITGDVHCSKKDIEKLKTNRHAYKTLYYQSVEDFKKINNRYKYGYSDYQIESWCKNTDVLNATPR